MILALLSGVLTWLTLWYIFLPIELAFLIIGVLALPADWTQQRWENDDMGEGIPLLSFLCNVGVFALAYHYFGVCIDAGWVYVVLALIYLLLGTWWSLIKWYRMVKTVKVVLQARFISWCSFTSNSWANIKADGGEPEPRIEFYHFVDRESKIRKYQKLPVLPQAGVKKVPNPNKYAVHEIPEVESIIYQPVGFQQILRCLIPQVSHHKGQVMTWLMCWPLSLVRWFAADMVTDFVNFIFSALRRQYQALANRAFSEF